MKTKDKLKVHCGMYAGMINHITGLTTSELANIIHDAGLNYIAEKRLPMLEYSHVFWQDFIDHWYSVDFKFISTFHTAKPSLYKEFHNTNLRFYRIDKAVYNDFKKVLKND